MDAEFKVKILGSNAASFAHGRHHTAQALSIGNDTYLMDCGEGTQIQMLKHGVKWGRLNTIFISHLHGDHCLGLPGLLGSMDLGGRVGALHIVGPAGIREWLTTYWRITHTVLNFKVTYTEVDTTVHAPVYEDNHVRVSTLPLDHRIPTTGYLFQEKLRSHKLLRGTLPTVMKPEHLAALALGNDVLAEDGTVLFNWKEHTQPYREPRSYAYCSDTRFKPALADLIAGVGLLYHEATYDDAEALRAPATFHSTAREAAQLAALAGAQKLIIGHFSSRYKTVEGHLQQAKSVFAETELALEGEQFEVPKSQAVPA